MTCCFSRDRPLHKRRHHNALASALAPMGVHVALLAFLHAAMMTQTPRLRSRSISTTSRQVTVMRF